MFTFSVQWKKASSRRSVGPGSVGKTASQKLGEKCGERKCLSLLSGSPAKSGPLDFTTENNCPSFFVNEKGLAHT